jgi:ANTAR domain
VASLACMDPEANAPLRVLVAGGPGEHLDVVTRTVAGLGHEVIARESSLTDVAELTATERPDVALVIVLRRFAEYHNLEGAFGRRALTERAKGILMERHGIDERAAFEMLREHARRTQRKLVEVAEGVVAGHRLLPARPGRASPQRASDPSG